MGIKRNHREIKKHFEWDENKNTYVKMNLYIQFCEMHLEQCLKRSRIRKHQRSKINNLSFHGKKLEKGE